MASVSTHGTQDKGPHLPPPSKQSLLFCPKSKLHIHRGEIAKIIRECQEESFWKRALPFSLVSMLVTQGLVYQGYLASNPRFGSLPKVALAGILGFGLGKASYIGVCQSKFHSFEDQLRGAGFGPGHNRHLTANQNIGGSNPPTVPRKKDGAIYFCKDLPPQKPDGGCYKSE